VATCDNGYESISGASAEEAEEIGNIRVRVRVRVKL
jgi:hypothetical protein